MFSIFKNKRTIPGLTGIELREDGVSMVSVVREPGRAPRVSACEFREWHSADEKILLNVALGNQLARARCTTLLDTNEYTLLLTEAPDVPPDELRSAMRWRIKDLIDFHVDDATIDVFDVATENTPGKARPMYVVAARNSAIQRRVDMCDAAGVGLDIIDIPELAQRNLASILSEDVRGVVMLSLAPRHGLVTITRQGELFLSRRMEVGTEAMLSSDNREAYYDQIALEIQRSLDYFDSHFRQSPIDQLVFSPSVNALPDLVGYLNQNLSLKGRVLNLADVLQFDSAHADLLAGPAWGALGAALRVEERAL